MAAPPPDLDAIFAALADGTRRRLLARLVDGDATVGALAEPLPMSLAAVSKHLQVLTRAGLVSQVQAGRLRTCRIEPDGLRAASAWMQGFGAFDLDDWQALEELIAAGGLAPAPDAEDPWPADPGASDRLDDPLGGGEVD